MSMFDSLLSAAGSLGEHAEQTGHRALLLNALVQWVNNEGGITVLIEKFKAQGLGHLVESWVSSGQSLPISLEQIQQIFGIQGLQHLSSATGQDSATVSHQLSTLLPEVVSKFTSHNEASNAGFDATSVLSMAQGLFGKA